MYSTFIVKCGISVECTDVQSLGFVLHTDQIQKEGIILLGLYPVDCVYIE